MIFMSFNEVNTFHSNTEDKKKLSCKPPLLANLGVILKTQMRAHTYLHIDCTVANNDLKKRKQI